MNSKLKPEILSEIVNSVKDNVHFGELLTQPNKHKYLLTYINVNNKIPKLELRCPKSNAHSNALRAEGNRLFTLNSSMYEALELYNESICFAENNSAELSIGYANRSAIYFHLKMYKMCNENIKLAKLTGNYPERLMPKLLERERRCLILLANRKEAESGIAMQHYKYQPKLSFSPKTDVPSVAEPLQMGENERFGRFITTKQTLQPGAVIAIDEPYTVALSTSHRFIRCTNCLKENNLNLIPCPNCTCAMFCDQACLLNAQTSFHEIECPIIDYLQTIYSDYMLLAIRLTIKSFMSFGTSIDLANFIIAYEAIKSTVFTPLLIGDSTITDQQRSFHQLYSLSKGTHEFFSARLPDLLYWIAAAIVAGQLIKHTSFSNIFGSSEQAVTLLMEVMVHFMLISRINHIGNISGLDSNPQYHGLYPFSSLLNHSCAPNAFMVFFGKKLCVYILRPVTIGQQLLVAYGMYMTHHNVMKSQRQKRLASNYFFDCKCEGCTNNYPLMNGECLCKALFPFSDSIGLGLGKVPLHKRNEQYLIDKFKSISSYLLKYDAYYPCGEFFAPQECLRMILYTLLKNTSLKDII